jgi:protoheme IX farnesyltransferase
MQLPVSTPLTVPTVWADLQHIGRSAAILFKLRIVSLLLLGAFGGAALGLIAGGTNSFGAWLLLTLCGTLAAAGASGINQYLERESDKNMRRTRNRPMPLAQIQHPQLVLWIASGMIAVATLLAYVWGNPPFAFWLLTGAVIYVGVYTIWLKPRTSLNIVIGGAAGSCAVLSGGAAVGAWNTPLVLLLSLLLFVWTPVHFWALALAYKDDYAKAGFPMLPALVSAQAAARWTALHTYLTVAAGIAIGIWPLFDAIYLLPIGAISLLFIWRTAQLLANPVKATALKLFHTSNIYLAAVLVVTLLLPLWR